MLQRVVFIPLLDTLYIESFLQSIAPANATQFHVSRNLNVVTHSPLL